MNLVSWDQISGILRQFVPLVAGIAIALGYLTQKDAETIIVSVNEFLVNVAKVIGPLGAIAGVLWSVKVNTGPAILQSASSVLKAEAASGVLVAGSQEVKKATLEVANAMPEVQQVKLKDTAAGNVLADAIPGKKVTT